MARSLLTVGLETERKHLGREIRKYSKEFQEAEELPSGSLESLIVLFAVTRNKSNHFALLATRPE
jgi:hypothetical protein